ncbi:MAG: hypothetical protein JSY10_29525 [Paenibacillus sp.]|nr:hypothetical protein [Paenibacillus sp.]
MCIRFALSSITAQWYFHRNEASPTFVPWKNALTRASTNSLGTIAFGSLILAVIQFLSFSARSLRKVHIKYTVEIIFLIETKIYSIPKYRGLFQHC